MPTVGDLLRLAEAEEGYLEKQSNKLLERKTANAGNRNYTKYGRDLHELYPAVIDFPAPWCDCFVDWCFYKVFGVTNAKALLGGAFDDYTVASARLYKKKDAWYTSGPRKGDQIFFHNTIRICHTGLVLAVDKSRVYTIEGNTSDGEGVVPNGGAVCRKSYALHDSKISGYGRPAYERYADASQSNYERVATTGQGLAVTAERLNVRSTPAGTIIGTLQRGTSVVIDQRSGHGAQSWFHYTGGWIAARYLTGWIREEGRWWYLNEGYTYQRNAWQRIGKEWYYFDGQGWMMEKAWICWKEKWYYLKRDGAMAAYCYVKSTSKPLYYWVNAEGIWEEKWNTPVPNTQKYQVVM